MTSLRTRNQTVFISVFLSIKLFAWYSLHICSWMKISTVSTSQDLQLHIRSVLLFSLNFLFFRVASWRKGTTLFYYTSIIKHQWSKSVTHWVSVLICTTPIGIRTFTNLLLSYQLPYRWNDQSTYFFIVHHDKSFYKNNEALCFYTPKF